MSYRLLTYKTIFLTPGSKFPKESSLILRGKMRIIMEWLEFFNLDEESIQDDLWRTLIFRPDIALFKITHLPHWWARLTRPNLIYWSQLPKLISASNSSLPFSLKRNIPGLYLPPLDAAFCPHIQWSRWHIYQSQAFDHKCHIICDGGIVVTSFCVTHMMLSQDSWHPGPTFVMCPAEDSLDIKYKGWFLISMIIVQFR